MFGSIEFAGKLDGNLVPRHVSSRPETGLDAPPWHWIRGELGTRGDDIASEDALGCRCVLDPVTCDALIEHDRLSQFDNMRLDCSGLGVELLGHFFVDCRIRA